MYVNLAGVIFRFVGCDVPLQGSFQGFRMPDDRNIVPDYIVVVRKEDSVQRPSADRICRSYVAESGEGDQRVEWSLDIRLEGLDDITEQFPTPALCRISKSEYDYLTLFLTGEGAQPYVYPLSNVMLGRKLLRRGGCLVHASVVETPYGGLLFSAKSGTGKTTIANLFAERGCRIINDDIVALRLTDEGVTAYNVPMPYYAQEPKSVKLTALYALRQCPENRLTPFTPGQAAARLLSQTLHQGLDGLSVSDISKTMAGIVKVLPMSLLDFAPTTEVVDFIFDRVGGQSAAQP